MFKRSYHWCFSKTDVYPQTLSQRQLWRPTHTPGWIHFCWGEAKHRGLHRQGNQQTQHLLTMFGRAWVSFDWINRMWCPFGWKPWEVPDAQGTASNSKQDLEGDLPEAALGSFHRHMPPLYQIWKGRKSEKKISGTTNVLGFQMCDYERKSHQNVTEED